MNFKVVIGLTAMLAVFLCASAQNADTLQPGPSGKDSYVYQGFPNDNYGDQIDLWIGVFSGELYLTYVEFDLTAYSGRQLDSCYLDLFCYKLATTPGVADTVGIWEVESAWSENSITWNQQPSFAPDYLCKFAGTTTNSWWSGDVKTLVQSWLDGSTPNYGFQIGFLAPGVSSSATFYSSDEPTGGWEPRLRLYLKTQKSITVTSPNGGENWQAGSVHNITWTSTGAIPKVKIIYTPKWSSSQWYPIASDYNNTGSFAWSVPNTPGNEALVQIEDAAQPGVGAFDVSDGYFTILPLSVAEGRDKTIGTLSLSASNNPTHKPVICYTLPELSRPALKIYSLDGREVRDLSALISGSSGTFVWDGCDDLCRFVPEGVYFCRLEAAGKQNTARITIIR